MNFELNLTNTFDNESVAASETDLQWKPMKKFKVASQLSTYLKSAIEMNEHLNLSQDSGKIIIQLLFISHRYNRTLVCSKKDTRCNNKKYPLQKSHL